MSSRTTLVIAACGAIIASLLAHASAQGLPKCSQKHVGRQHRAESLTKRGDSRMAWSAAAHTTKYAIERYGLQNSVSEDEAKRVFDRMYAFLSWKLGTPAAVAGQWLTAGYEHFDKAYVDEAGAMLIGILDFTKKNPQIAFPPAIAQRIKEMAGAAGPQVQKLLVEHGVPEELAKLAADKIAAELLKAAARNTVGVDLPKKYDFDNRLLMLGLEAFKKERAASTVSRGFGGGTGALLALGEDEDEDAPDDENASGATSPIPSEPAPPAPTPIAGPDTLADLIVKLTGITERLDNLEARLATLEAGPRNETGPRDETALDAAGQRHAELTSTVAGYDAAKLTCQMYSAATVRVKVNGVDVGRYESHFAIDLADTLEPGKVNTLAFSVEPRDNSVNVTFQVDARRAGKETFLRLLQFTAAKDHLEDSIEIPFVKN